MFMHIKEDSPNVTEHKDTSTVLGPDREMVCSRPQAYPWDVLESEMGNRIESYRYEVLRARPRYKASCL